MLVAASGCVTVGRTLATDPDLIIIPGPLARAAQILPELASTAYVPLPAETGSETVIVAALRLDPINGTWLHGVALTPMPEVESSNLAVLATFGGEERNAATVVRVLGADTSGRWTAARALAEAMSAHGAGTLIISPGDLGPGESHTLIETLAVFASAARGHGAHAVALLAPAADTATFPTRVIARIADLLIIGPGPTIAPAKPGPAVTTAELRRGVRLRASEMGTSRIAVLLPLHGYLWQRDSAARPISYAQAVAQTVEWRVPFARDSDSRLLFARQPAMGELWVPDAASVAFMVREARLMGVRRFVLVMGAGEDPNVLVTLRAVR